MDLSEFCGGAGGQQPEVVVTFSATVETCHLESVGCEPGLAAFLLGFFLPFPRILRLYHS